MSKKNIIREKMRYVGIVGECEIMNKDKRVEMIMAYESGELEEAEIIELFQDLVNSKLAWALQGSYGATASYLIKLGLVAVD